MVNYNYVWEQKHTDGYHQIMRLKALDRKSTAKIQSHRFLLSKVTPVSLALKKKSGLSLKLDKIVWAAVLGKA